MLYIKVKPEYDNIYYSDKGDFLIGNELYTIKEFEKIKKKFTPLFKNRKDINNMFEYVTISKNKTYWCFAARFAD